MENWETKSGTTDTHVDLNMKQLVYFVCLFCFNYEVIKDAGVECKIAQWPNLNSGNFEGKNASKIVLDNIYNL